MRILSTIFILLMLASCGLNPDRHELILESPSGNLKVKAELIDGAVYYQLLRLEDGNDIPVIHLSPMGLESSHGNFSAGLIVEKISEKKSISDSYTLVTGKQKDLSYKATEAGMLLSNSEGKQMEVKFRMFDEGLAFRYIFPDETGEEIEVLSESTGFRIAEGSRAWMAPYQTATTWGDPGYEANYITVKAGDPSPSEAGWAFPLLFHDGSNWIYISEAGLDEHYCATHLEQSSEGGLYTIAFPEANERYGDGQVEPVSTLPWRMPWRYVAVSSSLAPVYESSIVYHLSEPSKIEDTSWIKPGRASWEWWSGRGGRTVKDLKRFVDLAAEMGWEYSLVDAGWGNMPDGTIEEVVEYANQKNVGLLFWYSSGGRRNEDAKNEDFVVYNAETRNAEFKRISEMGVKGIKVDFFATDKQLAIKLYLDILRDAARHRLVVNFHGNTLPRGWSRTWPNLLTMEGIRGAEAYRFAKDYPEYTATYNTLAAVTRGIAGPADFTPATFSNQRFPRKTTAAHEMALTLVYETGLLHLADTPESYQSLPKEAIGYLRNVPVSWDETQLIQATPGEEFVVARRKGDAWYIAGINGLNEPREVQIEFPAPLKNAVIFADGSAQNDLNIDVLNEVKENIQVTMQPNGGFLIYSN